MNKNISLRSLLGISQREAALILQVSRSQLSLYELHLRDLPVPAMKKLREGWQYVEANVKSTNKNNPCFKEEEARMKEFLKSEIRENEFEQIKLRRKIEKMSEKYKSIVPALHALEFWKQQVKDTSSKEMQALTVVEGRTKIKLDDCGWHVQEQCKLKLKMLEEYRKILEDKMK